VSPGQAITGLLLVVVGCTVEAARRLRSLSPTGDD
jgi:hypothetical protein